LTIDYGPFGFLDTYNPDFICNGSDDSGRYSFKNQPKMCKWNLEKLAESIHFVPYQRLEEQLNLFDKYFNDSYMEKMRMKLGLMSPMEGDKELVDSLLETMLATAADYTNTFRELSHVTIPDSEVTGPMSQNDVALEIILQQLNNVDTLIKMNAPSLPPSQLQMMIMLMQQSPDILRMMGKGPEFLSEELKKWENFKSLKSMKNEEKELKDRNLWNQWLMLYRNRLVKEYNNNNNNELSQKRIQLMNQNNPKFILRNWIAQEAIEKAENGDFSAVNKLLETLKTPYSDEVDKSYAALPPSWSSDICVT